MALPRRPSPPIPVLAAGMLLASMVVIGAAPAIMPDSYSWIENTVSESGGQGVPGAWLFRSGVLLAAAGVLTLVLAARGHWIAFARAAIGVYATGLVAAVFFADNSWLQIPYDETEARLHTIAAFVAGSGFVTGVFTVGRTRAMQSPGMNLFDRLVILSMVTAPLAMLAFSSYTGLIERGFILVGYGWLLLEARAIARHDLGLVRARRNSGKAYTRPPLLS